MTELKSIVDYHINIYNQYPFVKDIEINVIPRNKCNKSYIVTIWVTYNFKETHVTRHENEKDMLNRLDSLKILLRKF
jgi:hypothetical protein